MSTLKKVLGHNSLLENGKTFRFQFKWNCTCAFIQVKTDLIFHLNTLKKLIKSVNLKIKINVLAEKCIT